LFPIIFYVNIVTSFITFYQCYPYLILKQLQVYDGQIIDDVLFCIEN